MAILYPFDSIHICAFVVGGLSGFRIPRKFPYPIGRGGFAVTPFFKFFSAKFFVPKNEKSVAHSVVPASAGQHRRGLRKALPPGHHRPKIALVMRQVRIRLNRCVCDRCGHGWDSRKVLRQCPKCGARLWNGPVVTGKKRGRPMRSIKLPSVVRHK